ncbi:MAG TPA: Npt1/Npt2 family nucleotide transporter [Polyangia bacterium]|nr:Npt1/Npt2 family nucleotide transporter [Polyangia bacterium]
MRARHGIGRLWDVRPGEGARTALMFANVMLLIAAYTTTKAVRDAVFLSKFGLTQLSYVMIGIAVAAGFMVSVFTRVTRRWPRDRVIFGTNTFIAVSLVAIAGGLRSGHLPWLSWALYFWSGVFGLLLVAEFWLLANDLFHAREAKRLFALIGAGGILGGVVGGALSGWLARPLGTTNLLYVVAAQLVIAAGLSHLAWKRRPAELSAETHRPAHLRFAEGVKALRKIRYVRLLGWMMVLMTICMTLVQWQYKGIAKAHFGSHRDEMTAFFGTLAAVLNLGSFFLQLLVTPRLLARFGVKTGLRVLPAGFLIGGVLLIVSSLLGGGLELAAAAVAVLLSDGFRFSVDKASVELLYLPIPRPVKDQAKPFIDTVADRAAGALAGVLWLFLTWAFHIDDPGRIGFASLVTIALVAVWLVVIARARGGYVDAYRRMLAVDHPPAPTEIFAREQASTRVCEAILRTSLDSDPPARTRALRAIGRLQRGAPELRLPRDRIEPHLRREIAEVALLARGLRGEGAEPIGDRTRSRPLLVRTLEERLDRALERITRLLSLVYPPRDILAAYRALHGASSGDRAGALELLDNLLEGGWKGELMQALDDVAFGAALAPKEREERTDTLALLLDEGDGWLRACAAFTARAAGLHAETLERLARNDPDPMVREAARGDGEARAAQPAEPAALAEKDARC